MQEWGKTRIDVPEMLVMEILSKLPVKSLTRFRCVCKSWCSSFQTYHFITKHYQNNLINNNLNLLLKRYHGNTSDDDDPHNFSPISTEKGQNFSIKQNIYMPFFQDCCHVPLVSGPCHGILCLCNNAMIALWSPSTREFKTLLQSPIQRPLSADSTTFGCIGFGFDSQTNDYKVVRVVTNYFDENEEEEEGFMMGDWNHQVELYSLKSDSWKEISVPEDYPHCSLYGSMLFNTYINGVYYWQATGFGHDHLILSFDMISEKFSNLLLPEFDGFLAQYMLQLVEFNGLLGAIVYPRKGTEKSFDLWVMNGSWTKQFSIESISGIERPLGFWENGELFLESSDHELVSFDPSTQELKNLGIHAYHETVQIITYVESLVTINGRSENEEGIRRRPVGDPSN